MKFLVPQGKRKAGEYKLNLMPFSITLSLLYLSKTIVLNCLIFNIHQSLLFISLGTVGNSISLGKHTLKHRYRFHSQLFKYPKTQKFFMEHLSLGKLIVFHYANLLPLIPTTE